MYTPKVTLAQDGFLAPQSKHCLFSLRSEIRCLKIWASSSRGGPASVIVIVVMRRIALLCAHFRPLRVETRVDRKWVGCRAWILPWLTQYTRHRIILFISHSHVLMLRKRDYSLSDSCTICLNEKTSTERHDTEVTHHHV